MAFMTPPRALVGGRSGGRAEGRLAKHSAARPVDEHRIGRGTRLAIDDDDARPFGGEVPVAPGEQGPKYRPEIAAALGQHIFVTRRPIAVAAPLEQPGFD